MAPKFVCLLYNLVLFNAEISDDMVQIKFKLIDKIKSHIKSTRFKYIDIDGIRLESETAWGLVRASNTSPNIVLRFEGQTEKDLLEIKNYFKTILSKIDNNLILNF